jgi:hypothetical protein
MNDWITEQELEIATGKAFEIYKDFRSDHDCMQGEQTWTEIEINGKFFDIECFDDDTNKPRTETSCAVYPVYPSDCGRWTETDGSKWIRLFTNKEQDNEC